MKRFSGNKLLSAVMSLFLGVLVPFGFAPFSLFPIPVLVMALWLLLLRNVQPGRAAWYGWLFGLGMFGAGIHWVYISVYLYGDAGVRCLPYQARCYHTDHHRKDCCADADHGYAPPHRCTQRLDQPVT